MLAAFVKSLGEVEAKSRRRPERIRVTSLVRPGALIVAPMPDQWPLVEAGLPPTRIELLMHPDDFARIAADCGQPVDEPLNLGVGCTLYGIPVVQLLESPETDS